MFKTKYYYDHKTLSYRKIEKTKGTQLRNILAFLSASIFFGIISLLVLLNSSIINTPTELSQAREISNYKFQFDLLNKKIEQLNIVLEDIELRDNNVYRVLFETNPIPSEVRKAGFGGINRYENLEGFDNSKLVIETTKKIEILTKQIVIQSKSLDEIERLATDKEKLLSAIPSIQPIKNNDLTRMASGFGYRTDPFDKSRKMHSGMDFTAPRNTPIYAASDGKVIRADSRSSGYGKHIRIDHGFGYVTLYAHLNKYNVRRNQQVKKGDIIGYVGSTGRSQAPHLHYEVQKDKKRINPINFYYGNLSPDEFDALLKLANQENQSLD
ncbi:MAG: M23 family metallopeptidase [Flavobacteriaceae bacterium]|jgi:murein DD-endopeptidase MepM/ murein hydrolase activator NlpD|nr:M23 family metallopeptidase [Flavobacteriaceae bacterium]MBT3753478.1 M23 family metallopeptidase [Flavobacteriaceae bacterium]MBT3794203.1 M23 family metallopeptidase [Flavobacteriaceae bacterium]MBT4062676.1 M23 family metallopeptidase [Flavobacteriaceae bacterium]MBT4246640.1 M23 family metallopeptidase [Flavobacteriaceae bacterium]|tara:strand:+ start:1413 stop:2390 length:978 start_codon:yes stop_codon:yes gene_type:complete